MFAGILFLRCKGGRENRQINPSQPLMNLQYSSCVCTLNILYEYIVICNHSDIFHHLQKRILSLWPCHDH